MGQRRQTLKKSSAQTKPELLETGIKIIDLLFPMVKGSKTGILGGAGLGKKRCSSSS